MDKDQFIEFKGWNYQQAYDNIYLKLDFVNTFQPITKTIKFHTNSGVQEYNLYLDKYSAGNLEYGQTMMTFFVLKANYFKYTANSVSL